MIDCLCLPSIRTENVHLGFFLQGYEDMDRTPVGKGNASLASGSLRPATSNGGAGTTSDVPDSREHRSIMDFQSAQIPEALRHHDAGTTPLETPQPHFASGSSLGMPTPDDMPQDNNDNTREYGRSSITRHRYTDSGQRYFNFDPLPHF